MSLLASLPSFGTYQKKRELTIKSGSLLTPQNHSYSYALNKCINNVLIRNMIFCIVFMITKEHYITISEQLG